MSSTIDEAIDNERNAGSTCNNAKEFFQKDSMHYYVKNNNKPLIIGFTGKAKSGKDTAAEVLKSLGGCNVKSMAFADPLKEIGRIFGFSNSQMYDQEEKEKIDSFWGVTPRKFLQITGTECFRQQFREDCWTKLLERRVTKCDDFLKEGFLHAPWIILVTDVRFPNEVECIQRLGGTICKVERPSLNTSGEMYKHPSEIFIDELHADILIRNTFDNVNEYKAHCVAVFEDIFKTFRE